MRTYFNNDIIYDIISYKHLTVLSPEAVARHIEGIAASLGPSTVELTLPLNAAERPQLPFATVAGNHQVVLQNGIQLACRQLHGNNKKSYMISYKKKDIIYDIIMIYD
jgi:hypothetical protein